MLNIRYMIIITLAVIATNCRACRIYCQDNQILFIFSLLNHFYYYQNYNIKKIQFQFFEIWKISVVNKNFLKYKTLCNWNETVWCIKKMRLCLYIFTSFWYAFQIYFWCNVRRGETRGGIRERSFQTSSPVYYLPLGHSDACVPSRLILINGTKHGANRLTQTSIISRGTYYCFGQKTAIFKRKHNQHKTEPHKGKQNEHTPWSFFSVSQNFCSSVKYLSNMNTLERPRVAILKGQEQGARSAIFLA